MELCNMQVSSKSFVEIHPPLLLLLVQLLLIVLLLGLTSLSELVLPAELTLPPPAPVDPGPSLCDWLRVREVERGRTWLRLEILEDLLRSLATLLFTSVLSVLRFLVTAGARPRLERPESWLDFRIRDFCGSEFFILRKSSLELVVSYS